MNRSRTGRSQTGRHGVVLLVVLSLLVLFILIAVTFVVTATRAKLTARIYGKMDVTGDSPKLQLDAAMMQLFCGTTNPRSSLQYASLLNSMYGDGWLDPGGTYTKLTPLKGTLTANANWIAGNQIMELTTSNVNTNIFPTSGYFNGCVLTMLDGAAAGNSTRIVGYNATTGVLRVLAFEPDGSAAVSPVSGDHFLINGRAFSGTGIGYNPTSGTVDAADSSGNPYALMPNPVYFPANATANYPDFGGLGGMNVDYTAADYNNMYLASLNSTIAAPTDIIPSFHRPALIQYWQTKLSTIPPAMLEKIMLRPNPTDHPNFTGSNPNFNPITGPWDVDNDGDGINDSVWIDLGYPAVAGKDGRLYKPLFAFLCVDLDGRANINTSGSYDQLNPLVTSTQITGPFAGSGATPTPLSPNNVAHGYGMGPAEMNLLPVLNNDQNLVTSIIIGTKLSNGGTLDGRLGESNLLTSNKIPQPGYSFDTSGNPFQDYLNREKLFDMPVNYTATAPGAYGSPPDLRGLGTVTLDYRGQPLYYLMVANPTAPFAPVNQTSNNPYEVNHGRNAAQGLPTPARVDNLFSGAEYERLLRYRDVDANTLPNRLFQLLYPNGINSAGGAAAVTQMARKITPYSFDTPAPSFLAIPELRSLLPKQRAQHITDLLRARLKANGMTDETQINTQLSIMLPWELIAGVRMNINRPFGNAIDNNGNGVIDEPEEGFANPTPQLTYYNSAGTAINVPFNYLNDAPGVPTNRPDMARQVMARQLYCLMMLLHDKDFVNWTTEAGLTAAQQKELTSRRIAQWAVNVVDFRDSDSIMTPFEYDVDPFAQGWRVDGIVGNINASTPSPDDTASFRRLVWGCEYPDMLLTESIAWHDRAVIDSANDDGIGKKRVDASMKPADPTMDQAGIPRSALFLELYCTRSANNPVLSGDLYTSGALDLGRVSPADGNGNRYPVWRVLITASRMASGSTDNDVQQRVYGAVLQPTTDPQTHMNPRDSISLEPEDMGFLPDKAENPLTVDRVIWFSQQAPNASMQYSDRIYYNRNPNQTLLQPGSYALVGPNVSTRIGKTTDGSWSKQEIRLDTVTIKDATGAANYPDTSAAGTVKPPLGIVVAAKPPTTWTNTTMTAPNGIGINISAPIPTDPLFYPEPKVASTANTNAGITTLDNYGNESDLTNKFLDNPLDSRNGMPLQKDGILATGTTRDYKTAVLQRLANPLEAWNPEPGKTGYNPNLPVNPYRTVDWLPLDLTVFNGEAKPSSDPNSVDPDDPNGANATVWFAGRQRGPQVQDPNIGIINNVWEQISNLPKVASVKSGSTTEIFDYKLTHTLGFLNNSYGQPTAASALPPAYAATYVGDPQKPFPWITWNNRPFANALELMLVPATSQARLLTEFRMSDPTAPVAGGPYAATPQAFAAPFRHLLNFFQSAAPNATAQTGQAAEFYRLLDYVQTPTLFTGTDIVLNPQVFSQTETAQPGTFGLHPPFNTVSRHRDPGKLNLNTVTTKEAFFSLMSGFPSMMTDAFWQKFQQSRSGSDLMSAGTSPAGTFAGVFRSPGGADLVPLPNMKRTGVQVGLLRPDPANSQAPLFSFVSSSDYANSDRSDFFRYEGIDRLGNMVTNRSNVFAVWVTVGYFEVTAGAVDAGHLDGYRLGAELGSDTGEVKRHRAFYIFDRTIPVGYERGQLNNVQRAILLKRYIE